MEEISAEKIIKLEMRESKLIQRHKLPKHEMRQAMIKVSEDILDIVNKHRRTQCVALYSAINKEIDMTFLAEMLVSKGVKVALPRVQMKREPLVFNEWNLMPLQDKDAEGIPCSMGAEIRPDMIIVPLVAFSRAGHRLGYGSGYYDRTFNQFSHEYKAIGVGYSFQETDALKAEAHDVAMHVIITEKEIIEIASL